MVNKSWLDRSKVSPAAAELDTRLSELMLGSIGEIPPQDYISIIVMHIGYVVAHRGEGGAQYLRGVAKTMEEMASWPEFTKLNAEAIAMDKEEGHT